MKDFEKFIKKGIVKKQSPDLSRANALVNEADKDYDFIKEIIKKFLLDNNN